MAELASGAVSSLLGVIRNEALLLGGVRGDVQFIKEEMESMKSFLAHLARTACNNCIDLYLYRGNPGIHRARGGLRRYLWWASWFLHKLVAKHRAAEQLRQLKDRARDVGERRLRYGVEVPMKRAAPAGALSSTQADAPGGCCAPGGDDEEDSDDQLLVATTTHYSDRRAIIEPRTLDDYVEAKLLKAFGSWTREFAPGASVALSMVIVAPYTYQDVLSLAQKTLLLGPDRHAGYDRVVQVDIQAVHYDFLPLSLKDVVYYILRELEHSISQTQEGDTDQGEGAEEGHPDSLQDNYGKYGIYFEKNEFLCKIKATIKEMKIDEKLDKIAMSSDTLARPHKGGQLKQKDVDQLELDVIFQLLHKLPEWDDKSIDKIAIKFKEHMEADKKGNMLIEQMGRGGGGETTTKHMKEKEDGDETTNHVEEAQEEANHMEEGKEEEEEEVTKQQRAPIRLNVSQYAHILKQVFLTSRSETLQDQQQDVSSAKHAIKTTTTTLSEDQIKKMINHTKQEILRELQEGIYEQSQARGKSDVLGPNTVAILEETEKNSFENKEIEKKMHKMKEELKEQLEIKWLVDKIKHHLKNDCPLIILRIDKMMGVSTWNDIRYALGLLQCGADLLIVTTTKDTHLAKEYCYPSPGEPIDYSLDGLYYDTVLKLTNQNEDNYDTKIFHDILKECDPHEFCMKIFTHALYANPKRSNEELHKLHRNLQALPKSFNVSAKKMFMFSYNDLPKEYKSCLLYLVIFPLGHKIRRSTLIARWVTEGLTLKEDWPSSVSQANRCFDALVYQCLVYPAHIGVTGKVQSCVVDKLVHGFITTIARKQHIVETRLSHHLARHFSIFNDLQLRSSDKIDKFFQRLSEPSRVSLLKVLDLEGSRCINGKIQRYVKDICNKMLLLKYLSLKGTDITYLPSEINNLRELEVLDIWQTKVPAYATANVLLLKLKRLLAGHISLNPTNPDTIDSVQIPQKIDKMINMEVLSNVKVQSSKEFKDIGKLWQLRKLEFPADIRSHLQYNPKRLESLSIRGTTLKGHLFPLFTKNVNNNLIKITLSSTQLNQDDLNVLTKLSKLRCIRLRRIACLESNLTFRKDELKYLKYLLVEGSNLINITFEDGAACELQKMVLSFTSIESISGAETLPKLEDLELNNNSCNRLLSSFDDAKKITKLTLRGTLLKQDDLDILAKKPNVRCLELLDRSCDASQNQITFKKDEFTKLNLLIVDCSSIAKIIFASGSAPKLEKIIWSPFTSLSDIDNLPRLKELEFNGAHVPNVLYQAIGKHNNKPKIKCSEPETQDETNGDEQEDDGTARFSLFWKRQIIPNRNAFIRMDVGLDSEPPDSSEWEIGDGHSVEVTLDDDKILVNPNPSNEHGSTKEEDEESIFQYHSLELDPMTPSLSKLSTIQLFVKKSLYRQCIHQGRNKPS
ncbi:hypothetical protein PR202_gb25038 [Eleusine coracana subsp. coracana]|uniref:Uncharacterized protein n=1 Tax=Eleusine coracana subsp. coracana TaxID=191504 RepID=A0AAV5FMQ2_ELECO|nr:hypothetical protein PR202_gb25038 [Eleusine coracana subsp. coracana]